MLNKAKIIISILLLSIFFSSVSQGQDGTIKIESKLLQSLIQKADTHVLIKIKNGSIYALDSRRNTIYPSGYVAPKDEVFYVFDVYKLKNVLLQQQSDKNALIPGSEIIIILKTDDQPQCPPACP